MKVPKVGDKIYVPTSLHMSRGSDDVLGGLAIVSKVKMGISGGEETPFVSVKEHPNKGYNWKFLSEKQKALKKEFGKQIARPDPDVDRPWIEDGDSVDGKPYKGPPIW
jgi:hypothetical protein